MAKRLSRKYKKVQSAEVQGDGSFVIFSSPTFDDIAEFSDLIFSSAGVPAPDDEEKKSTSMLDSEAVKLVVPMLKRFVIGWDWVDDDDQPLVQPKEDPSVIDRLTMEEQTFLVTNLTQAFNVGETATKN